MTTHKMIRCWTCGYDTMVIDVGGACPGSVFCRECDTEIGVEDGLPTLLCRECESCQGMKRKGNSLESINSERAKLRQSAIGRRNLVQRGERGVG